MCSTTVPNSLFGGPTFSFESLPHRPIDQKTVLGGKMPSCTTVVTEEVTEVTELVLSPTIYLDDNGDLRLCVGADVEEHPQDFVVCSRALGRSSPVLKAMLFGGFAESRAEQAGGEWSVDLPEDSTQAMEIVLNIVHGHFHLVPEQLPLMRLYEVLTITEKYDMTVIIRPWSRSWMQAVKHHTDDVHLLCVAWELGDAEVFQTMFKKMICESMMDLQGRLVFGHAARAWKPGPEGYNFPIDKIVYLRPPEVFETIAKHRQTLISANLDHFVLLYRCLKEGCRYMQGYFHSSPDAEECNSMLLGSLVRCLAKGKVDITLPNPCDSYRGNVLSLEKATSAVKLLTVHRPSPTNQCLKRIEEELAKGALLAAETKKNLVVVQPEHRGHLEVQSQKTGFVTAR
ncbi:uncharacterized protein LY79DRAFT_671302 [Colletotrichum navitas]|uniref:Nuclear pore protein n=1 Tax=Colletotrichum navitas TaxID=681940 RepID=A0AAD8PV25_9PEZI|nr:uncharacterized protein LY79DRAFT_671302 [Colletotrichum navitas]KAK1585027.1 hypothetical protein LY79DRAFT_671302 [Colletotrichum navitas]